VRLLAQAIGWVDAGAPFALIAPGPYWRAESISLCVSPRLLQDECSSPPLSISGPEPDRATL
jgi:hypothetical protein